MIEHKPRRGRRLNLNENGIDDDGGEVVGIQHARRASEEGKRNSRRMVEMVSENEEELNDCKEHTRALLAYPSGRGPTHRNRVSIKIKNTILYMNIFTLSLHNMNIAIHVRLYKT